MATNKVKLFKAVQTHFNALGFSTSSPQPNQRCKFNRKNLFYILVSAIILIPVLGFSIFKAQSVYEYGITFYTAITLLGLTAYYMIIIFEMGEMLKLIEKYEGLIEKRKR